MCIPLAYVSQQEGAVQHFEGYCKAALFLVRQMLHHCDVRDCGVPIYIGVSENGREMFDAYAWHCDFPESHIVPLPSYASAHHGWHSKFDLLGAPALERFERRLHLDASWWLRWPSKSNQCCQGILSAWTSQDVLIMRESLRCARREFADWGYNSSLSHFEEYAKRLNRDAKEELLYWTTDGTEHVSGGILGFSKSRWGQSSGLISQLRPVCYNDEMVLAILAREEGWQTSALVTGGWQTFFAAFDYLRKQEVRHVDTSEKLVQWQSELGYDVNEESGASAYPSRVLPSLIAT